MFEQSNRSHTNLSRIDPTILCAKATRYGGLSLAIHFRGRYTPTVCLSVIRVGESFLLSPKLAGSKYQKMITGTFHSLEYERWVAVLCVIYGVKAIRSQTLGNLVTFSTRVGDYSECFISTHAVCNLFMLVVISRKAVLICTFLKQEKSIVFRFC